MPPNIPAHMTCAGFRHGSTHCGILKEQAARGNGLGNGQRTNVTRGEASYAAGTAADLTTGFSPSALNHMPEALIFPSSPRIS